MNERWEYYALRKYCWELANSDFEPELKSLGDDRWELVETIYTDPNNKEKIVFLFKRAAT